MPRFFTGLYPSQHGVMSEELALPADLPTLAEALRERGLRHRWIRQRDLPAPRFGLDRGFERYVVIPRADRAADPPPRSARPIA